MSAAPEPSAVTPEELSILESVYPIPDMSRLGDGGRIGALAAVAANRHALLDQIRRHVALACEKACEALRAENERLKSWNEAFEEHHKGTEEYVYSFCRIAGQKNVPPCDVDGALSSLTASEADRARMRECLQAFFDPKLNFPKRWRPPTTPDQVAWNAWLDRARQALDQKAP